MNFKYFIMGGVALASVFEADAFTVQDLVGDNGVDAVDRAYWSRLDGSISETSVAFNEKGGIPPIGYSNHIRLEPVTTLAGVNKKQVKVVGLTFNGISRDFIFSLADENNTPVEDGTRLILVNNNSANVSTDGKYLLTAGLRYSMEFAAEYGLHYNFGAKTSYGTPYNPCWVGHISENAEGEIVIDFEDPAAFVPYGNNPYNGYFTSQSFITRYANIYTYKIIDHYHIEIFKPNAYMTGSYHPFIESGRAGKYGSAVSHDPIPCKVTFGDDGTFSVVNLTGDGYAIYQSEPKYRHGYRGLTGGYDASTGKVWLDGGQDARVLKYNVGSFNQHLPTFGRVANVDLTTAFPTFTDVVGEMHSASENEIHHVVKNTHWVTNGGTCRTFAGSTTIDLPPFAYSMYSYIEEYNLEILVSSPAYSGTTLEVESADITLNTDMTLDLVGINDTHIRVEATLDALENTDHVDAYELWMVPGKHADGAVNSTPFNHENGHENAVLLQRVSASEPAMATYASGAPATYKFNRLIAKADLAPANTHPDDVYSFFVKAHYNPATNLAPTFHNLVSDPLVVTGIDGVDFEAAAITAGAGVIRVAGTDAPAAVYTVSGAKVYEGTDRTISVAAGIYIVKAGDTTAKVVVR